MRTTSLALLLAPALAFAQDAGPARPTGSMLLDALPPQADLAVAAPDLPALLDAFSSAGAGSGQAWRDAFDAQMRAWGEPTGEADRLVAGARALFDAADGEALVASVPVKLPGVSRSARGTLLAFRTTRDAKTLRAALRHVVSGGLSLRYDGTPRAEEIAGRPVVSLPSATGSLHVVLQDGLVVACDHPLALGLFLKGLEVERAPKQAPGGGALRLLVRHGRAESAWEGWIWGDLESLQWRGEAPAAAPAPPAGTIVVSPHGDAPLLPLGPADLSLAAKGEAVGLAADGRAFLVADGAGESARSPGGASRFAWLRAMADGKLPAPIAGVLPATVRAALPVEDAGAKARAWVPWTFDAASGKLSAPLGNGPVTFLALRTLGDIARGGASPAPPAPAESPRPGGAPLPPPTEPEDR